MVLVKFPFVMIHHVPFISLGGSSDRKRMIGQSFLSVSSCGGVLWNLETLLESEQLRRH